MTPYEAGYSAARAGFYWVMNPWHPSLCPAQRMGWEMGYSDALEDRTPMPARRLEPEFTPR